MPRTADTDQCDGCKRSFRKGTLRRDFVDSSLLYCDGCPPMSAGDARAVMIETISQQGAKIAAMREALVRAENWLRRHGRFEPGMPLLDMVQAAIAKADEPLTGG